MVLSDSPSLKSSSSPLVMLLLVLVEWLRLARLLPLLPNLSMVKIRWLGLTEAETETESCPLL